MHASIIDMLVAHSNFQQYYVPQGIFNITTCSDYQEDSQERVVACAFSDEKPHAKNQLLSSRR